MLDNRLKTLRRKRDRLLSDRLLMSNLIGRLNIKIALLVEEKEIAKKEAKEKSLHDRHFNAAIRDQKG